jgi:eukaryotic-like serine/threonine-protein kinase
VNSDRWQQIKQVFTEAVQREASQRDAFLAEACADDSDLRAEVESLLTSYQTEFMAEPAIGEAAEAIVGARQQLLSGQRIGRYRIVRPIGAGGMGEVYLAHDMELERDIALKILGPELIGDSQRMQRFIQEAKTASALNHPNIITIYEVGQLEGTRFIVTEYIKGETLRRRMKRGPLQLQECFEIAVQIASALAAAHEAKVVHRDIKPENVMLRPDGLAKVLDFGLAKLTEKTGTGQVFDSNVATRMQINTAPGMVLGTFNYMSPEQARGKEVDARTDIWSFGVVLYEMITGRLPFNGETTSDVMAALLKSEPEQITAYAPDTPSELQRITRKALRKERDERYQTIKDLLLDLKSLQREIEFAAEMGRSAPLELKSARTDAGSSGTLSTSAVAPPTISIERARTASSAEYIVGEIKQHKGKLAFALTVIIAALLGIGYVAFRYLTRTQAERASADRTLTRLTYDAGLQSEPTWSPDGHFIAYSSDRSGNFDIWIKPIGEGDPIQVTKSPAHDRQPDWSPDGQHIAFRSERDGGGLYVVPAFGGNERKIASFGYRPLWSPDASMILFFSSNTRNAVVRPKVYVVALDGSPPREILAETLTEFSGRWHIGWHPDSRRISIWGDHSKLGMVFWTLPLAGGPAVKSEINSDVDKKRRELNLDLFDFRWSPSGQALFFEGVSHGVRNLWKVRVDPKTLSWVSGPERLTVGAGLDSNIALSADGKKLAFVTRTEHSRIWSIPFNAMTGQVKGPGQAVSPPEIQAIACDVTQDGKKLVFIGERAGKRELWVKSFEDGSEKLLFVSDKFLFYPLWSRDGTYVIYASDRTLTSERTGFSQNSVHSIAMISVKGGEEQSLTTANELQGWPWDWSADPQNFIGSSAQLLKDHWGLYLFPVAAAPNAESQMRLITEKAGYNAFAGYLSPDARWISLTGASTRDEEDRNVYVVEASGGEWIRITDGKSRNGTIGWSPDGKIIYFDSNRSGFTNVWAQPFNPISGQPGGEPFRVTNFESPTLIETPGIGSKGTFGGDRLVEPLTEVSASVWVLDNVDQ